LLDEVDAPRQRAEDDDPCYQPPDPVIDPVGGDNAVQPGRDQYRQGRIEHRLEYDHQRDEADLAGFRAEVGLDPIDQLAVGIGAGVALGVEAVHDEGHQLASPIVTAARSEASSYRAKMRW